MGSETARCIDFVFSGKMLKPRLKRTYFSKDLFRGNYFEDSGGQRADKQNIKHQITLACVKTRVSVFMKVNWIKLGRFCSHMYVCI